MGDRAAMKLERIPWGARGGSPDEGTLRRALENDGFDVCVWSDPPNRTYDPHAHDHDECLWVVRGAIVFQIDGRDFELGPGDRLMLPRGTVHGAQARAEGATYLIGERA